jgi:ribosomal protein S18 acetylase RimI-like enzyme
MMEQDLLSRITIDSADCGGRPCIRGLIAEAQFYPDNVSRAVVAEEGQIVGFALYGIETISNRPKIFRLMIGESFQGRGLGRAAMQAIIQDIRRRWDPAQIYVSFQNPNAIARRLYASLGFEEVEQEGEKITARLSVSRVGSV